MDVKKRTKIQPALDHICPYFNRTLESLFALLPEVNMDIRTVNKVKGQ